MTSFLEDYLRHTKGIRSSIDREFQRSKLIDEFVLNKGAFSVGQDNTVKAPLKFCRITPAKKKAWFQKGEVPEQFFQYLVYLGLMHKTEIPKKKEGRTLLRVAELLSLHLEVQGMVDGVRQRIFREVYGEGEFKVQQRAQRKAIKK